MRAAEPELLNGFDVAAGTVQDLTIAPNATGDYAITVTLADATVTMALHEHDLRAPGFALLVRDATGLQQVPTPACVTFRGALIEHPESKVVASIIDGQLTAQIHRPATLQGLPGETWVVQPVQIVEPNAGPRLHLVYRASDNTPLPYHCANTGSTPAPPMPPTGVDATVQCEIALEGDVQFYNQNNSSVTNAQNDITSVMNQVDFIFDRDCDVQYIITQIIITTTGVYSTNDPGGLLSEFGSEWNTTHASVPRDVAHLFTGRNLSGSVIGVAYLGSICNIGGAYGLSQSRFSSNFNRRVGLTAHELGHSFSAPHCNSQNPCFIMCSGLGGCSNSVTQFGPSAAGQISSFAQSRSCLTVVPTQPILNAITPSNVTVFAPGVVVLSGSGFFSATSVRIGSQTLTSGFSVTNDSSIALQMPQGLLLGTTTIDVTTSLGTSNSLPVTYTPTSPPRIQAPTTAEPGNLAVFQFGGTPSRQWFIMIGPVSTTSPFQGFPLLDLAGIYGAGVLDPQFGFGNFSIPVPPGLGLLPVFSQIIEATPSPLSVTGTSALGTTLLLN
ncbi:MAG: M12 family metallo-peptidase [Planctomycetota bacterium]|nr:M12 family metallo-peptidase [Planctomycetota bacterium]